MQMAGFAIDANHPRQPATGCRPIHDARHAHAGDRPLNLDNDRLVSDVMDDCQILKDETLDRAIKYEIHHVAGRIG